MDQMHQSAHLSASSGASPLMLRPYLMSPRCAHAPSTSGRAASAFMCLSCPFACLEPFSWALWGSLAASLHRKQPRLSFDEGKPNIHTNTSECYPLQAPLWQHRLELSRLEQAESARWQQLTWLYAQNLMSVCTSCSCAHPQPPHAFAPAASKIGQRPPKALQGADMHNM